MSCSMGARGHNVTQDKHADSLLVTGEDQRDDASSRESGIGIAVSRICRCTVLSRLTLDDAT